MAGTIDLSIVVPAYNESHRLTEGLRRLTKAIENGAIDADTTEVLVVDDGSTDGTGDRAGEILADLPHLGVLRHPHNRGKGAAIRTGVAEANGRVIAFGDADMAIDPEQFPLLVSAISRADVAIGARSLPGSQSSGGSARRRVMGRIFNRLVNALTHLDLGDTQCGFKGFPAPVARLLFHCTVIEGFAFDVEVLYVARQLGLTIEQVPVSWRSVEGTRIRPLADPFVMASDILGGWARRRPPTPVPALAVAPSPTGTPSATTRALEATLGAFPVLADSDGGATVLFPMASQSQLDAVAAQLEAGAAQPRDARYEGVPPVRRVSMSFAALRARAPLELVGTRATAREPQAETAPTS